MAVATALGSLGAVALGTFMVALLLRWLWDALVAVTRFRSTCRQLKKFPIPPWRNWLLGHTGMVRGQGWQLRGQGWRQLQRNSWVVAPVKGPKEWDGGTWGNGEDGVVAPASRKWGQGVGTCKGKVGTDTRVPKAGSVLRTHMSLSLSVPSMAHMSCCPQGQSTEEGLQQVDTLVAQYRHGCLWWGLPWLPVLRLFHPSTLRPLLSASGRTWDIRRLPRATHGCHHTWQRPGSAQAVATNPSPQVPRRVTTGRPNATPQRPPTCP